MTSGLLDLFFFFAFLTGLRSGKKTLVEIMVIENCVVSYTPLCVKVVISIIEPFQSELGGGGPSFSRSGKRRPRSNFWVIEKYDGGRQMAVLSSFYRHP